MKYSKAFLEDSPTKVPFDALGPLPLDSFFQLLWRRHFTTSWLQGVLLGWTLFNDKMVCPPCSHILKKACNNWKWRAFHTLIHLPFQHQCIQQKNSEAELRQSFSSSRINTCAGFRHQTSGDYLGPPQWCSWQRASTVAPVSFAARIRRRWSSTLRPGRK